MKCSQPQCGWQGPYYKAEQHMNICPKAVEYGLLAIKRNNYPAQSCGISSDFSQLKLQPRLISIRRFRRIAVKYEIVISN